MRKYMWQQVQRSSNFPMYQCLIGPYTLYVTVFVIANREGEILRNDSELAVYYNGECVGRRIIFETVLENVQNICKEMMKVHADQKLIELKPFVTKYEILSNSQRI